MWKRRALFVAGLVVASGLLLLLAAPSAGQANAFETCVADAEGMAAKRSAAELDVQGQSASVEELCAGYRG